jgi:sporulation protein YlmC with PRC-barrel domain
LPLLALGGLLWYLLPTDRVNQQASEPAPTTTSQPASLIARQPETRPPYLTKASDDSISIGAFYNQDIYNRAGEKLGTVKDLLIGPDGRVSVAIINVGRFLGIGEKDVAVPFSVLIVDRRDGGLRISVDAVKETLQSAPAFEQMRERIRTNAPKMFAPEANPASGKGDAPGVTRP